MLVFPNQPVTDDQQIAFSKLFGPLETAPVFAGEKRQRLQKAELTDISNLDPDGKILAKNDVRRLYNMGNQFWHTGSSFKYELARASLRCARGVPPVGGETEYADMRAAYDALPEAKQRQIQGLVAEHSIFYSRSQQGFTDFNQEIRDALRPVPQAIARTHPGSLRKTLYLASPCVAHHRPADR